MGSKVSDLTALAGADVAVGDLVYVVDVSATTSGSKKMTLPEFFSAWPVAVATEILGSAVASTDELLLSDAGVAKTITIEELGSALAILGFPLGDIPEYADQAAAQAGLSGTGKLWRQTTTGLLGVTIA